MSVINRVLNDIEDRNKIERQNSDASFESVAVKEPQNIASILLVTAIISFIVLAVWLFKFSDIMSTPLNDDATLLASSQEILILQPVSETSSQTNVEMKAAVKQIENTEMSLVDTIDKELIENEITESSAENKSEQPIAIEAKQMIEPTLKKVVIQPVKRVTEKRSLSITPVSLSKDEIAQLKLAQGIKFQNLGQISKAQTAWQEGLAIVPSLHDARIQLAASYYGENDTNKALALLLSADKQYPQFMGYRLLAAQIYYQLEQPSKALAALQEPYLTNSAPKENLVLAASLAQQLKNWSQAQLNYHILVQRERNSAQWVLGLAIALDAQQVHDKALNNYQHLLTLNIDKAVYEYAQQRISLLTEELARRGSNG